MKHTVLMLAILFLGVQTMAAQQSESSSFKDKTWYGSHVALGFTASSARSDISLGLAPMMGYRIFKPISVGPRASLLYQHTRFRNFNGDVVEKFNSVDKGIGAFIRAEVYRQYFIQAELMYESIDIPVFGGENQKINGMNSYIGVGMNAGGQNPSVDLMLTYDLNLQAINKLNLINVRFGFTLYY